MADEIVGALQKIVQGIQFLGDGLTAIIRIIFASFGLQIPELAIRIGTIILVVLVLWRFSNAISKIFLYAMIFILISMFAGLIPAIGEYLASLI